MIDAVMFPIIIGVVLLAVAVDLGALVGWLCGRIGAGYRATEKPAPNKEETSNV